MPTKDLLEVTSDHRLRLHFHPGQLKAWDSGKRFILVLAGTGGGKTSFGPPWLWREIQRCGPGSYLAVSPTYDLMERQLLPEFRRFFEQVMQLGTYTGSPVRRFNFSPSGSLRTFGRKVEGDTRVLFGHAQDPESLESLVGKACWIDEGGQKKFRIQSWEAIQRRIAFHEGRVLITTTPYDLGWLKTQFWDPWVKAGRDHPYIDVIRFESIQNPAYPTAEYERARLTLPPWRFDLFYRAVFTRPAGLIYDAFDEQRHIVPRFRLPDLWPRHLGLDFGGVNTAGVFIAEEQTPKGDQPTGRYYAYREYHHGGRTAADHKQALLAGEPSLPRTTGGSGSEDQWRAEFAAAGLPVYEPKVTGPDSVEVGINRVYGLFKTDRLYIMDDLTGLLDELRSYSRELDDSGQPTEKIEAKDTFHRLDALRYVGGQLADRSGEWADLPLDEGRDRDLVAQAPPGVFHHDLLRADDEDEELWP